MSRISRIFETPTEFWWQDFKDYKDSFGDSMIHSAVLLCCSATQISGLCLDPKRVLWPHLSLQIISLNDRPSHSKMTHSISRFYKPQVPTKRTPFLFFPPPTPNWEGAHCPVHADYGTEWLVVLHVHREHSVILRALGFHFIHLLVSQETQESRRGKEKGRKETGEGRQGRRKGRNSKGREGNEGKMLPRVLPNVMWCGVWQ